MNQKLTFEEAKCIVNNECKLYGSFDELNNDEYDIYIAKIAGLTKLEAAQYIDPEHVEEQLNTINKLLLTKN